METTEKENLKRCYLEMYRYMVNKDIEGLSRILDDSFILTHMMGMRQNKNEFISSIELGALNYYSALHECIEVENDKVKPQVIGQSRVEASVFGGGRSTWSLQLIIKLKKNINNNQWLIIEAAASTY